MFMKRLAYHILGRSNKLQIPITNFQLNKLVYFTVIYALKKKTHLQRPHRNALSLSKQPFRRHRIGNHGSQFT